MMIFETLELTEVQALAILSLWNREYPERLKYTDVEEFYNYLGGLKPKKHYFFKRGKNEFMGWGFLFERENESWFAMILDSTVHGKGLGTNLLNRIQAGEKKLNAWVIDHGTEKKWNGEPYRSPLPFYLKNDFTIASEQRLETNRISAVKIVWRRK